MEPTALIQCIPNFSEGRRTEVIEAIAEAIAACGVKLLSVAPDADQNRTVMAFVGNPANVANAALRAAELASRLIDLNHHRGSHPRMGALDVLPFIPIAGCGVEDCVTMARQVGQAIGGVLGIPVYLYEGAATRPERKRLAHVRQGGFEDLRERVGRDAELTPDYGPETVHPSAGCTAVGARMPLVTFIITLGAQATGLVETLESTAGIASCRMEPEGERARLVIQIEDYQRAPLHQILRQVKDWSGISVLGTAIAGPVPMEALVAVARHSLQLEGFQFDQVLEKQLME